jgi:ribose transport system permease protein
VSKAPGLPIPAGRSGAVIRADFFQRFLAFGALIALILFFQVWCVAIGTNFLTFENFVNILVATAVVGILALGETFVIITGGIDLSVGTVMTISMVMTAVAITSQHLPVPVGILVGVLTGGLMGLANGVLIARLKIAPFIATLGILNVARGLSLVITQTRPIYFSDNPEFQSGVMGNIFGLKFSGEFGIPNIAIIMFGAAIVAAFVLGKTVLGRYTFALGSNEEAARLSGVNVANWKMLVYGVCGLFAGLAGVLSAARLGSAQPATGFGYELSAISAVVIGGTSLSGGEGTILGTIIGAFIVYVLTYGLQFVNVAQEWQIVVTGGVLIAAVYIDNLRRRQRA